MNQELELFLSSPLPQTEESAKPACQPPAPIADELVLEASRKITLRCGKSSITLYPNGKIVLRGDYILSDAEGLNKIVGGQVELN